MSEAITLYQAQPSAQDQAPVDIVAQVSALALRGPQAVMAYSMAFDRLPEDVKRAHVATLHDARDIRNAEFLELFVAPPKVVKQLVRNTDGSPFIDPITGSIVYEDVYIPNENKPIFDRLRAAVPQ